MWRLFVVVAACLCRSLAVASSLCEDIDVGNFVSFHITTWRHLMEGNMELVENSAAGIGALSLTGNEYVAVVVHGRESGIDTEFGHALKRSLIMADKEMVVFLVDWPLLSDVAYEHALDVVPCVAKELKGFLEHMVAAAKLNPRHLHLIGFDLGAHIVGIASRHSFARAQKITALDPAGENWGAHTERLRSSDAHVVEVIHTNGKGSLGTKAYGIGEPIGTLDIFPNGGDRQPGCGLLDNVCHHTRAWKLFVATVDYGGHLIAMRCQNMSQVNENRCVSFPPAVMGTLELFKFNTGLHRVNTGSVFPF